MPPKYPPRKSLMHGKELAKIAEKPSRMSRAGVFACFYPFSDDEEDEEEDDDNHDISPPASTERRSPTQTPEGEEEAVTPTPVVPGWAHAGFQVPTMGSNAPAPPVAPPALLNNGYLPPSFPSMPLGPDAASGSYNQMVWDQALGYYQRLAYERFEMQTSNIMPGAVNDTQRPSTEPSLSSASTSHEVPADSNSPEDLLKRQTATDGYGSAYAQPRPAYTRLALGENSTYTQPLPAGSYTFIGSAPLAMSQPHAWAWSTRSSGNVWEAPVSFAQQTPTSATMPVNNQLVNYYGSGMPGPSNNHLPAPTPLMHRQELQQSPLDTGLTMAQSSNLPKRLLKILSEKDWRDTTKSGSAMERLETLHSKFQRHGEFNHHHLKVISDLWNKHGLKFASAQKPWDPLFWFAQFYSWIYTHRPENEDTPHKRLFVGTLLEKGNRVEIWVGISSRLQFFDGPGPNSSPRSLDVSTRLEVEWYEPLNELFDLELMPYDNPTKTPGSATKNEEFQYLTYKNSGWRQRQNNHIKCLILFLEAFPGLIMREGAEISKDPAEDQGEQQVYKTHPSFPFLDDEVDTSRSDLSTLLLEQENIPEHESVTLDSASIETDPPPRRRFTRISWIERKRKGTAKATTRPSKQLSTNANTTTTPTAQESSTDIRSSLRSCEPTSTPDVSETSPSFEATEPTPAPEVPTTIISTPKSRTNDLNTSRHLDGNHKALYLLRFSLLVLIVLPHWLSKTPTPTPTSN
ncbi:hypothetical protein KCU65_g8983, partial [Aureobasidium melanogenum]